MAYGLPADKLCEKLKKQDKQICELKYGTYEQSIDIAIVTILPCTTQKLQLTLKVLT